MTEEQKAIVDRFVADVRVHYGARLVDVVLFGSRARGDAADDSDFDMAIVIEDGSWQRWTETRELAILAYGAEMATDTSIQPWPIARSSWEHPSGKLDKQFIENIKREGWTWPTVL